MKNAFTALMILTTLGFSTFSSAEDLVIPVIAKPSVLQEGTQRELTAGQIAELLPWAKNSKSLLSDMVNGLQGLSTVDKIERLELGIKAAVNESAPKNSELLMRYILNRALVLNNTLMNEMSEDAIGTSDTKLRVLLSSVNMSIKYYDLDMKVLNKQSTVPFAQFGIEYFKFLSELNKSIFDASASYAIQKTALEWLQWDLFRDLKNTGYAPQIVKINNGLKLIPVKNISDAQALTYIRQMKLIASQLDLQVIEDKVSVVEDKVEVQVIQTTSNTSNAAECRDALATDSYRGSCTLFSKRGHVAPGVTTACGEGLLADMSTLACISMLVDYKNDWKAISIVQSCDSAFATDSSTLFCIDTVRGLYDVIDIEKKIKACGDALTTESNKLSCLGSILTTSDEDIVQACGDIMATDSSTFSCISKASEIGFDVQAIHECGQKLTDSSKLRCIKN